MAKVITHLCVAIRQYTDKDGKEKTQYQRIGCEMEDETGKRFLILDRFIALAGIPDFSNGKYSDSVLISKFSVKKKVMLTLNQVLKVKKVITSSFKAIVMRSKRSGLKSQYAP